MIAGKLRTDVRPLAEITRLIEMYEPDFRRWCASPENGGCWCSGCVRHPPYKVVGGDPEYRPWPDEADALNAAEVALYRKAKRRKA